MTIPQRTRICLGVAAAIAAGGVFWWLFARAGAAPVAVAPAVAPAAAAVAAPLAPVAAAPRAEVAPIVGPVIAPAAASIAPLVPSIPAAAAAPVQAPQPVAAGPVPSGPVDEVAATERMYMAHASLRTPEVADPDSEANRRILGTMVAKALAGPSGNDAQHSPASN